MTANFKRLLHAPVWVLGVFGQSKSFVANPLLGNRTLNRLGLHAARVAMAHAITRLRWRRLANTLPPEERTRFARDGFLVIPNFLTAQDFDALNDAARALPRTAKTLNLELRENSQGDTLTQRVLIDSAIEGAFPQFRRLLDNPRFKRLLNFCGARKKRPLHYVQRIVNGARRGRRDPQKTLHADTFHPTLKAWFFLDRVDATRGPFTYVAGSNRLSLARLRWEYQRSVDVAGHTDGYSEKGSPRISSDELEALGLGQPQSITVEPNTLVIADTFGFHRRGDAKPGRSRVEIWSYSRTNPFNPFVGIGSEWAARLEQRVARAYWQYKDRQAEERGWSSSWHLIPPEEFRLSG